MPEVRTCASTWYSGARGGGGDGFGGGLGLHVWPCSARMLTAYPFCIAELGQACHAQVLIATAHRPLPPRRWWARAWGAGRGRRRAAAG